MVLVINLLDKKQQSTVHCKYIYNIYNSINYLYIIYIYIYI